MLQVDKMAPTPSSARQFLQRYLVALHQACLGLSQRSRNTGRFHDQPPTRNHFHHPFTTPFLPGIQIFFPHNRSQSTVNALDGPTTSPPHPTLTQAPVRYPA